MFTINGNYTEFTQWQQGYTLSNPNMKAGDKVKFFNGAGDGSVMTAKNVNGAVIVEVPNIMLQHASNIIAKFEDGSDYTSFKVTPAPKENYEFIDNEPKKTESSGGGASSWNDLTDKPFGETTVMGDTLTWDGNTDGLYSISDAFYHISDVVPTLEELQQGVTFKIYSSGAGSEITEEAATDSIIDTETGVIIVGEYAIVALEDGATITDGETITFEKAGIYLLAGNGNYISSLTINNYTGFEMTGITTIPEKYLPPINLIVTNITYESASGNTINNAVSSKTIQEIKNVIDNGGMAFATIMLNVGKEITYCLPLIKHITVDGVTALEFSISGVVITMDGSTGSIEVTLG